MRKSLFVCLSLLALLFLDCTPAAPTPSPPPATPQPAEAPATPAPNPEEAAWAKVVEAAKKEGKVNLYAYTFTGDRGLAIIRAFQGRYGLSVDIITGRGAEFGERLKTEHRVGQVVADVFEGSSRHTLNIKLAGLLANFSREMPVLREKEVWLKDPRLYDPEGFVLGYDTNPGTTMINTRLVKPDEVPKSANDLLEPKWRGKLIGGNPKLTTSGFSLPFLWMKYKRVAPDWMERYAAQKPYLATGERDQMEKLARGEYPLTVYTTVAAVEPFVREGAPIRAVTLKEGARAGSLVVAAVKNGPHPNAAKLFLNWFLSADGQMVMAKATGHNGIRLGLPDMLPEPIRIDMSNAIWETEEDAEDIAQHFREGTWVPLFLK